MCASPKSQNVVEFQATVARVQTLSDGGIRITLDMGENYVMQAAQLMECKRFGVVLEISAEPLQNNGGTITDAVEKGTERKSRWSQTQR